MLRNIQSRLANRLSTNGTRLALRPNQFRCLSTSSTSSTAPLTAAEVYRIGVLVTSVGVGGANLLGGAWVVAALCEDSPVPIATGIVGMSAMTIAAGAKGLGYGLFCPATLPFTAAQLMFPSFITANHYCSSDRRYVLAKLCIPGGKAILSRDN